MQKLGGVNKGSFCNDPHRIVVFGLLNKAPEVTLNNIEEDTSSLIHRS